MKRAAPTFTCFCGQFNKARYVCRKCGWRFNRLGAARRRKELERVWDQTIPEQPDPIAAAMIAAAMIEARLFLEDFDRRQVTQEYRQAQVERFVRKQVPRS